MADMKPERYTDMPKGYLTYPYVLGNKNSMGLGRVLLKEKHENRYIVEAGNTRIDEKQICKQLWGELKTIGCTVSIKHVVSTTGKHIIAGIPVEIRKIRTKQSLSAIRIRVTGETHTEVIKRLDKIQEILKEWQIQPTECVWSQGGWKTITEETKPTVSPEEILKEQKRLKNIVADMQDKIQALEKPSLIKSMNNERKARAEVLK